MTSPVVTRADLGSPDPQGHLPACGPRCVAHCRASPAKTADYTLSFRSGGEVTRRRNKEPERARPSWTISEGLADLVTLILARGDVRAHPSQADLRRKLRNAMESEARPVVIAFGFRFALGTGALWSYQGLPLCVRVEDVPMWQAATKGKKARRRANVPV